MYSTLKSGNVWHGEIKNRAKDGSYYWVDTTISPLENEDGKIYQYLAIRTLITERKNAEHRLKENQEQLEKQKAELEKAYAELELSQVRYFDLYDLAPVGYLTVDEFGIIAETNLTFALMLGTSRISILNKPIFNFIYSEDQLSCQSHRTQLFITAVPQSFEVRLQKADGNLFWARFDATLRISEKETPLCRIAVTDFTKRKELELKLQNYMNVLENINHTKDKFFSIIAHDLKNPFAGIIGISDLLEGKLKEVPHEHSPQYIHYTQMIQTTSKSAFTLLENLLLWARSQTGDIKVNPTRIAIHHLISFTIPIVNGNAFKKNITIETNYTVEEFVYADESFVSTILRNLLTNAIKFTYPNGKIIVSTERKNEFLEISISDSGMGIDPKQLNNLFKIDSKVSKLGTEKEKGSGLGLILCKDFVEKQGGRIWVKSKLGQGSTFTFTLPLVNKDVILYSTSPVSS